jgi:hypothetical protein
VTFVNAMWTGATGSLLVPDVGGAFLRIGMEDTNPDGFFDLVVTMASNDVRIELSSGAYATTKGALSPSDGLTLFDAPN